MKSFECSFRNLNFSPSTSILLNFFFPFTDIRCFFVKYKTSVLSRNRYMLKKLKLLKKPLFQKRRWSCDFPPRKTPVALKHRAISRQEKMAFSTPVGLSWDSPPPPTESVRTDGRTDVRMYGRTDGRSRDYYVTTKISRIDKLPYFLSNGAPLAGFARRPRYKYFLRSLSHFRDFQKSNNKIPAPPPHPPNSHTKPSVE